MEKNKRTKLCFLISVFLVFFSGAMAFGFQTNFGAIDVQRVEIFDEATFFSDGTNKIVGRLYRPRSATGSSPAPGVIGLHGYNNDKDVMRPAALELARVGIVVLTIDEIGHGDSGGELNWYIQGSSAAYDWLQSLAFVDETKMGIYGHSMGYIVGEQLAGIKPDHDACAFISFPPLLHNFNDTHNVLHLWAQYEEWYTYGGLYNASMTVSEIIEYGLLIAGQNAGIDPLPAEVDTTYGDFALNTSYREHLALGVVHPGLSMDQGCNAEITAWMLQALSGLNENEAWALAAIPNQIYLGVEIFSGLALLFSFISVIFLTQLLLTTKFFAKVQQPMPERVVTKDKKYWWLFAAINTVIAGIFYGLFTHADEHWDFQPPLNMGMMNNFLGFYLTTAAAATFLISLWYIIFNRKERGSINLYDLGVTYDNEKITTTLKNKAHWQAFGKTALLAITLFAWMYALVSLFQTFFLIEFRIFWSMAKMFTPERFLMFLLYLPIFLPFFLVNGGVFLFGQIRQEEAGSSIKTHLIWWAKICFAMLTGLIILILIQYIGVTVSNYPYQGWWFNPIMPLQLFSIIPLSGLLYFIMIIFFRKTGKIYLGSIFAAIITVWFLSCATVWGGGL
ncbi:MAG: alpha/beta hydrolase [Candidatus Hermodarchaeota archaeon]